MNGPALPALISVLERARSIGFLGPGPVEDHVEHARRFVRALDAVGIGAGVDVLDGGGVDGRADEGADPALDTDDGGAAWSVADIGAGGGVPGLVLLVECPGLRMVLIDAAQKRCAFLVWALAELELSDRAEVWCGRAEELGHEERARERFDAVVARGFGPPSITLECATGLVRPGGYIVISEPPQRRRWPSDGLAELALEVAPPTDGMALFRRRPGLAARYPRPARQQQRRPTFDVE